jgi:ferredoxin-type protein NapH
VGLASLLRDNRAFCKYACPVTVFLRAGARLSLLRVSGSAGACTGCGACDRACPMDVPVSASVHAGGRVRSAECILCQRCMGACAQGNLHLSLGLLDVARAAPRAHVPTGPSARLPFPSQR